MTTAGYGALLVVVGGLVVALLTVNLPWVVEARSSVAVCRIYRLVGQDCTPGGPPKPGPSLLQYAQSCPS
ncbi:hypothetical protein ACQEU6_03025 [Spirillospora sp. CA-108201]